MSKTTKRKYVEREVLEDFIPLNENQQIVKVMAGRGNNLHEVQTVLGETFLASMPTKFRKSVWIKRGDFVVTEPIGEGDKVKAEIVQILYKYQIKQLKQENMWPFEFNIESDLNSNDNQENVQSASKKQDLNKHCDVNNDSLLFFNTNRPILTYEESSSDSSSDIEM